ncbi:MAG: NHL repeat-containing protein [Actinobacteria bacterium]|nr:NHL repeat-containing protein [Actinomycetota bacterium]
MKSRRFWYLVLVGGALTVLAVSLVSGCAGSENNGTVSTSAGQLVPGQGSENESQPVSDKVWQATLALHVEIGPSLPADQPADMAVIDGTMFVVDTGHGQLVEVTADGKSSLVLDGQVDPKLVLSAPMAIASNQGQLYVADSGTGRVLILAPSGKVSQVITLARGNSADALPPRPIGIAVWSDGSFAVSDANNHRLIKYDTAGNLLWTVGSGVPATGENGFNVPGGLALDRDGNVYVVDILNAQVKKYSADGKFVSAFGQSGDTAGRFSRAKAVAVDDAGNIYVSDSLAVAVQVFDQAGTYLGLVGRKDPGDQNSAPLFEAPHGLKIMDGKLYVVDRYAGLFVFDLPATPQGAGS